ncbi:MAG: hypothetical protein M5R36_20005 [Deltaproteobacteria bacterium]|nr:hypothetical protein [Deltaproteobacteria bacterium]
MAEAPRDDELRARLENVPLEKIVAELRERRPDLHNTTDLTDRGRAIRALEIAVRPPEERSAEKPDAVTIGLRLPRDVLRERIRRRLRERIERGMIDEARALRARGLPWERFAYFGLEYKYLALHLRGELTLENMERELAVRIGQFAKRQETWLRKMEREGIAVRWIDAERPETAFDALAEAGVL